MIRPKLRQALLNRIPCPTIISALACWTLGSCGDIGIIIIIIVSKHSFGTSQPDGELSSSWASKAKQAACIQHMSLGCRHVLVTFSAYVFDFTVFLV